MCLVSVADRVMVIFSFPMGNSPSGRFSTLSPGQRGLELEGICREDILMINEDQEESKWPYKKVILEGMDWLYKGAKPGASDLDLGPHRVLIHALLETGIRWVCPRQDLSKELGFGGVLWVTNPWCPQKVE